MSVSNEMMGADAILVGEFQEKLLGRGRGAAIDRAAHARMILEEAHEAAFELLIRHNLGSIAAARDALFYASMDARTTAAASGDADGSDARTLDGLCDLKYVTGGAAYNVDLPLAAGFREVHRSNMTKVGGAVVNGKLIKPPGYSRPDLVGVLAAYVEARKADR